MNRFFPIHQAYEDIEINGKSYSSLQAGSLLEFKKEEVIAIEQIKDNIAVIKKAAGYFSIKNTWNEIKNKDNVERQNVINEKITTLNINTQWLKSYYQALYDFANAVSVLGYDIKMLDFTVETMEKI